MVRAPVSKWRRLNYNPHFKPLPHLRTFTDTCKLPPLRPCPAGPPQHHHLPDKTTARPSDSVGVRPPPRWLLRARDLRRARCSRSSCSRPRCRGVARARSWRRPTSTWPRGGRSPPRRPAARASKGPSCTASWWARTTLTTSTLMLYRGRWVGGRGEFLFFCGVLVTNVLEVRIILAVTSCSGSTLMWRYCHQTVSGSVLWCLPSCRLFILFQSKILVRLQELQGAIFSLTSDCHC